MIDLALGLGVAVLAWLVGTALRRRYHDKLTTAYCEGFKDGVNYQVKVQAEQGKRVVMKTVLSLN